jgi:hypothetical protein
VIGLINNREVGAVIAVKELKNFDLPPMFINYCNNESVAGNYYEIVGFFGVCKISSCL